ncbi:Cell division protein ZapA [Vibrio stylophorae]|uniref:Cell division protein ZapA n=1 Tax=Vibrio stylophorae TaxID=659351 RepID=A0ABM8ZQN3_9VIBR|nr:cell division protein ZapA [Vibrio stylophorae]CAH0532619.1 Cell division protein ZapA [Vibrio stylophorae]
MTTQAVQIEVLGRRIGVNCPTGQEQALHQAANYLKQELDKLAKRANGSSGDQILTIAALNVCYELLQLRHEHQAEKQRVDDRIMQLQQALESALKQHSAV